MLHSKNIGMYKWNLSIVHIVLIGLCLKTCAEQLYGRNHKPRNFQSQFRSAQRRDGYNKKTVGCRSSGKPFKLPSYDDLSEFKTCYEQVAQVRKNPKGNQGKRTREAILEKGFNLITYNNVTTKDGYILTVFRITGHKNETVFKKKPAVMLLHCIVLSSDGWFFLPGNKTLASKLVNEGYEVWLPNVRGTDYSQGHVNLNAKWDLAYWDFSMEEIAIYDLPAIIDLMLAETGNEKIFFVGFSMASNLIAIALAEIPSLNDKIEAGFWMGSSIYLGHTSNVVRLLTYLLDIGPWSQELAKLVLRGRIVFGSAILNPVMYRFCSSTAMACGVCGNALFSFFGYDSSQVEYGEVAHLASIAMNTVSFKQVVHVGENMRTCRFQKYNYGTRKNYKLYGQPYPPLYNLSNLSSPVYIYYADSDNMAPPLDQRLTRDALPPGTVKGFFRVKLKQFNHGDFLIAKDADILVYDSIVNIIKSYRRT